MFRQSPLRCYFYPRPPRGGRPVCPGALGPPGGFLSTPSARRATFPAAIRCGCCTISIHALREEGDAIVRSCASFLPYFYPRPPRGGRPIMCLCCNVRQRFLSTPSARRATSSQPISVKSHDNFYPRPPRGGRRNALTSSLTLASFLSTPSARRATRTAEATSLICTISIHALREEGDFYPRRETTGHADFYPRPPRGGRLTYTGSTQSPT